MENTTFQFNYKYNKKNKILLYFYIANIIYYIIFLMKININ